VGHTSGAEIHLSSGDTSLMAVILVCEGESGTVRPGDAAFSYKAGVRYPLHIGIYVGYRRKITGQAVVEVVGLPADPRGECFGRAKWGTAGTWSFTLLGQHLACDPTALKGVVELALRQEYESSLVDKSCVWSDEGWTMNSQSGSGGLRSFRRGTCAEFVDFAYRENGIVLTDPSLPLPADPRTRGVNALPHAQAYVFWSGHYGLRKWQAAMEHYPSCLAGERSVDR